MAFQGGTRITNALEKAQQIPNSGPATFLLSESNTQHAARRGTRQLIEAFNEIPWLRAVAGKIASAVAETHWRTFTTDGRARPRAAVAELKDAPSWKREKLLASESARQNLVEKPDSPLRKLLTYGNPRFDGGHVIALTQIYLDLVGEAFILMERDSQGTPVALWNLNPSDIVELPTAQNPYFRLVIGGHQTQVPVTEVLQFQSPNPADPYGRSSGIADALREELSLTENASKHLNGFFYNRARPDIIITADGISREETKRLEDKWLQQHRGFWNSHKPHFFNRNVEIKELGQSFENMQLTELRQQQRDTIMQVFGISPEILGILENANRSTVVHAQEMFQRQVVQPRVEAIRNTLQRQLAPLFSDKIVLEYESPVVQDKEHELEVLKANRGVATINEWRDKAGLPSLGESGDRFLRQAQDREVNADVPDTTPSQRAPARPRGERLTLAKLKRKMEANKSRRAKIREQA